MNCPLCERLADPKLSALLANDSCVALLAPSEHAPGRISVVPRKHIATVFDCDEATWLAVSTMVRDVTQVMQAELDVHSVSIVHESGPLTAEDSAHLVVHVMPHTKKTEELQQADVSGAPKLIPKHAQ